MRPADRAATQTANAPLAARLSYAQVWEDEAVLTAALQPRPGAHLLSIASAGDNALALALRGATVTAIDLSLPQLALTELKLAATELPYDAYLAFLGAAPSPDRAALYGAVRGLLSPQARAYWDAHPEAIAAGVLTAGRLERFFATFRRWVLPLVHRAETVDALVSFSDLRAQREFFQRRWDTVRWRALFRVFFSRAVIALFGRSREHFAHVDAPVSELLLRRADRALTHFPVAANPYLEWILSGRYHAPAAARAYLAPEGHLGLRQARERIHLVHAELGAHLAATKDTYDGFNYSDLFEYLPPRTHQALLEGTLRVARPGARVAYWNLFVPRARPEALADRLDRLTAEAASLHAADRAFLYGAFQLEVVR